MTLRVPTSVSVNTLVDWGRKAADAINQTIANLASYLPLTGGTLTGDLSVPDEVYGVAWNGSLEVPTKNALYDKIETISGGGVSDGDKGDITVSGTGATWTIDNDVVTYAKMQNVSATSRILGRITAGAGDTEELTAANVKTILGLAQADIAGLTTVDSPQFTAINLGHASDTTISRVSAGVIAVEGVTLLTTATGQPLDTDLTSLAGLTLAQGDLLYRDATQLQRLAAGTSGQVLRTAGSGANPVWGRQAFRGALVTKAADQTAANYTTRAAIAWDAEAYDTDTIHDNATNNSRLTVPSGVTYVRLIGQVQVSSITANLFTNIEIQKNGASFIGKPSTLILQNPGAAWDNITSPVLAVSAGDYFQLMLEVQTDNSVTVVKDSSWFAMEIIE